MMEILFKIDASELSSVFTALAEAGVKINYPPAGSDIDQSRIEPPDDEEEVDDPGIISPTPRRVINRVAIPRLVFARSNDGHVGLQTASETQYNKVGKTVYRLLRRLWEDDEWACDIDPLWQFIYGEQYPLPSVINKYDRFESIKTLVALANKKLGSLKYPYSIAVSSFAVELKRDDSS